MKNTENRSGLGYLGLYIIGLIVGAANVIPGVSGGSMAFILGIYEELLNAIRSFTSIGNWKLFLTGKFRQALRAMPWSFMVILLLGVLSASVLMAKPIKWMLENELAFILAFFFGLVAASVITVLLRLSKFRISLLFWLALGTAAGWLVVGLTAVQSPPDSWWYMMLCGAVAICAMILPGISGSFILMLMGRYKDVLGAIENLTHRTDLGPSVLTLALFTVGVVVGLASFAQLLSWTFKRYRDLTIATLAGFMVGSLRKIWPWKAGDLLENGNVLPRIDDRFYIALGLMIIGFLLVMAIEFAARYFENKREPAPASK